MKINKHQTNMNKQTNKHELTLFARKVDQETTRGLFIC